MNVPNQVTTEGKSHRAAFVITYEGKLTGVNAQVVEKFAEIRSYVSARLGVWSLLVVAEEYPLDLVRLHGLRHDVEERVILGLWNVTVVTKLVGVQNLSAQNGDERLRVKVVVVHELRGEYGEALVGGQRADESLVITCHLMMDLRKSLVVLGFPSCYKGFVEPRVQCPSDLTTIDLILALILIELGSRRV